MLNIQGKCILLAVTGSISAYKSAELCRLLIKAGAQVRVIMSQGGQAFITPLTFQALTGEKVHIDLMDADEKGAMGHISLAKWADIILIAPASANCIANLAAGVAKDLLGSIVLAASCLKFIAPAMNQEMYADQIVKDSLAKLQGNGWIQLGPESGIQACGDTGAGRLMEPNRITALLHLHLVNLSKFSQFHAGNLTQLQGKTLLLTAGATREYLDPVRFISNESSGKMGIALANAACVLGLKVQLIAGNIQSDVWSGLMEGIDLQVTQSAQAMYDAVHAKVQTCDIFIGCAAVSDWTIDYQPQKLKKNKQVDHLSLDCVKTQDIIASVGHLPEKDRPLTVGFAAETSNLLQEAKKKLTSKQLDLVVANDVAEGSGTMGGNASQLHLVHRDSKLDKSSEFIPKDEGALFLMHHISQTFFNE